MAVNTAMISGPSGVIGSTTRGRRANARSGTRPPSQSKAVRNRIEFFRAAAHGVDG
jgi:hypothetical protein